jgi:hypothetical protein
MELQVELANLETQRQTALKNAEFAQARELAIQQTALTRVITQANIDQNVALANLEKRRIIAVEQGKLDLATKIANLEKEILIAKVNAQLALDSRKLDDALAIAAYQGEQSLQGLETEIDFNDMKTELTKLGFDIQLELGEMETERAMAIQNLIMDYKSEMARSDRNQNTLNNIIGAIATVGAAYLKFSSGLP